jgi:hypothetical protein
LNERCCNESGILKRQSSMIEELDDEYSNMNEEDDEENENYGNDHV